MNISNNNSIQNLHLLYKKLSNCKQIELIEQRNYSVLIANQSIWPNLIYSDKIDYLNDDFILNRIISNIEKDDLPSLLFNYEECFNNEKLKSKNIYLIDKWSLMDLDLNIDLVNVDKYHFEKISTHKDIEDWVKVLSNNLFANKKLNSTIFRYLVNNGCELLQLKMENQIIATSLVYYDNNNVAGIYMVSVNKVFRGKGYGKLMMHYTFNCINEKKIKTITLQSTKSGFAMYSSLNFNQTGHINLFYKTKK